MKIINYPQYNDDYDCVINGRILINKDDFKAIKQLVKNYVPDPSYFWHKEVALKSLDEIKDNRFHFGVTMTRYIVENMAHSGKLKARNYFFQIINN